MKHSLIRSRLFSTIIGFILLFPSSIYADILDHWQLRNQPFPYKNIHTIAYGNNTFVAINDGSTILTSPDGSTWTERTSGTTSDLYGIAYGRNTFVAVGYNGTIITSPDGNTWTERTSGTTKGLSAIAYGRNTFVAVGYNGTILTSPDGITWTERTSGTTADLSAIAYGNSTFLTAGGGSGVVIILTSVDGVTWASTTIEKEYYYTSPRAIAYGNNTFVVVGEQRVTEGYPGTSIGLILTSPDGVAWTEMSSGSDLAAIAYGNNTFVAVGYQEQAYDIPVRHKVGYTKTILTSADGITWTQTLGGETGYLWGIAYGNNAFVATGYGSSLDNPYYISGFVLKSADGMAWTQSTSGHSINICGITYDSNTFVAVGYYRYLYAFNHDLSDSYNDIGTAPAILTSPDGITWTERASGITTEPSDYVAPWYNSSMAITHGKNAFVAIGSYMVKNVLESATFTSSDGSAWTSMKWENNHNKPNGIAYGRDTFVAVGGIPIPYGPPGGTIFTSPDGIAWTERTSGTANMLQGIAYGNSMFITVGDGGTVLTSADSSAWTAGTSGTTSALHGIAYGNDMFIAVGDGGTVLTSADGIAWSARTSGTTSALQGIAYGNGMFVAVGGGGTVLTSADGSAWTARTSVTTNTLQGITYGNHTFVAVGASIIVQTPTAEVKSSNATITEYAETNAIAGSPASFTVHKVVSFTATDVIGSADFSISFDSLPANPVFAKIVGGTWKQLYPQNECSGITDISLTGTTLNFTMSVTSDCNGTATPNTIVDPLVAGSGSLSNAGGRRSGCFIATAAYGSYFHPFVAILKSFRDRFLMTSTPGQAFVNWYYRISPPIADIIQTSAFAKSAIRMLLLPAVGFSYLCLSLGLVPALLLGLLSAAFLCMGMRKKILKSIRFYISRI